MSPLDRYGRTAYGDTDRRIVLGHVEERYPLPEWKRSFRGIATGSDELPPPAQAQVGKRIRPTVTIQSKSHDNGHILVTAVMDTESLRNLARAASQMADAIDSVNYINRGKEIGAPAGRGRCECGTTLVVLAYWRGQNSLIGCPECGGPLSRATYEDGLKRAAALGEAIVPRAWQYTGVDPATGPDATVIHRDLHSKDDATPPSPPCLTEGEVTEITSIVASSVLETMSSVRGKVSVAQIVNAIKAGLDAFLAQGPKA